MKKLVFASVLAMSLGSFAAFADDIAGYVSESHCGAAHNAPSAANTACIKKCLKGGTDPVLVSNGKVMQFDAASKDEAKAHAGENVTIDGSMEGDVVKITRISTAK